MQLPNPVRPEIDHRTLKLLVGVIALTLAPLTAAFSPESLESISEAYHVGGWSQSVFVGFLFAIASFLLAYNGESKGEMVLSKVAAAAALGVALIPCGCNRAAMAWSWVHYAAAAVMFTVLAAFCRIFYFRARAKGWAEARLRANVYFGCGVVILASMAVLLLNGLLSEPFAQALPRIVFWGEAVALTAFGVAWLTASRTVPGLARTDERFSPMAPSPER